MVQIWLEEMELDQELEWEEAEAVDAVRPCRKFMWRSSAMEAAEVESATPFSTKSKKKFILSAKSHHTVIFQFGTLQNINK